jgi:hypothetical protein
MNVLYILDNTENTVTGNTCFIKMYIGYLHWYKLVSVCPCVGYVYGQIFIFKLIDVL